MKLAQKIFIIIGMIVGCTAIFPLILGGIVLYKMKKGPIGLGWKIVTLLFVNMIAGILLLIDKEA